MLRPFVGEFEFDSLMRAVQVINELLQLLLSLNPNLTYSLNCNSSNVLYLMTCKKCALQYVGSTITKFRLRFNNHAPVPEKTISANRGLNHANRGIKFVLRLDCVPQNTISTIPGIK